MNFHEDTPAFAATLPPTGRLLGLDIGGSAIGLALSDTERRIATPLSTLVRENIHKDTGRLRTILREHNICGIVIGLPKSMSGDEGESCVMVRSFAQKLSKKLEDTLPVLFQDERFSTAAASRALSETSLTRKKRDALDDKMAAAFILQGALDGLR
ncbi:MAG: yrrK [Rickettsiales bacterium]|jgi:putative Holliday junction resolvase|nr:yrrK [Rickettsiales bacterium]